MIAEFVGNQQEPGRHFGSDPVLQLLHLTLAVPWDGGGRMSSSISHPVC